MCGIAGFVRNDTWTIPEKVPVQMLASMQHRGPDGSGWLAVDRDLNTQAGRENPIPADCRLLLLHVRLAIIDLSEDGHQPMSSEDGRYHISYNGEIYNYVELRLELEKLGHQFRSKSDTEVLLKAWIEWGKDCLNRLVGMFAFSIVDLNTQKMFLARDFFGIKPLYYSVVQGKGIVFASEIKSLRCQPGVGVRANRNAVTRFLVAKKDVHPTETFFADIQQVAAGHYVEISIDNPTSLNTNCYWQLHVGPPATITLDQAKEEFKRLFLDNVRLHLRSDVPIGAALSGGLDSTAIVSAIRHLNGNSQSLHSFSYIARGTPYDEERWVDIASTAANTISHKTFLDETEVLGELDKTILSQDEPFLTSSIYAQRRVFELAKEAQIKVMLDGQGADEMMAGYSRFFPSFIAQLLASGKLGTALRFCRTSTTSATSAAYQYLLGTMNCIDGFNTADLLRKNIRKYQLNWLDFGQLSMPDVIVPRETGRYRFRSSLASAVSTSLQGLLRYEDRNSMHYSIESRVPFLTPQLAEFLISLPDEFLLDAQANRKKIMRTALRDIAPDETLDRVDKVGFQTPEKKWLDELQPKIDEILDSPTAKSLPFFRSRLNAQITGENSWRCICLIRWFELFKVDW